MESKEKKDLMKNSGQISVKDLIQLTGSLCMGTTSFLGLNYWLGDNILAISLFIGIVIFAVSYGLVYVLVKTKTANINRNSTKIVERVSLAGYIIVAVVAGIFTLHYLSVEMYRKTGIKVIAENSIKDIDLISQTYKTQVTTWMDAFTTRLANAVRENDNSILKKYGLSNRSDESNITTAVKDFLTDRINEIETTNKKYTAIEAYASAFKTKGLSVVGEWSYFSIMNTLTHIDNVKQSYIDELLALSKQIPAELNDMTFNPPQIITMHDKLNELENIDFGNGAYGLWLVVFLITNFMTLFPYLFVERKGLKRKKNPHIDVPTFPMNDL
jgi:hypothetical protein